MTELIVRHCAPTLAGIKTGSLVSCPADQVIGWLKATRGVTRANGLETAILCRCEEHTLLYVYRPDRLREDLGQTETRRFLSAFGYDTSDTSMCVKLLRRRFRESSEFPHEIGVFLGYPLPDVIGFIVHRGRAYLCIGCWKVYADETRARQTFARYRACTRRLLKRYQCGESLDLLIAANG